MNKQTAINNINRLLAKIDAPVGNSDHAKGMAQGYIFACNDFGLITQAESLGLCSQLTNRSDNLKIDELSINQSLEEQRKSTKPILINWCPKCNHNEATCYSTASQVSGYEFMDGDEVVCLECGNTGEMNADGEDSDVSWNEEEVQEPANE